MTKILAVTVAFNSSRYIARHILSIAEAAEGEEVRHIIVDNSDEPACREIVEGLQNDLAVSSLKYIPVKGNPGYGAGVNIALKHRRSNEFVFISNPDTYVTSSSRFRTLTEAADGQPTVGAVLPLIIDEEGVSPFVRGWVPSLKTYLAWEADGLLHGRTRRRRSASREDSSIVRAGNGSALLQTPSCIEVVGGFDERFFLFMEDTDLWKRIDDSGLRIVQVQGFSVAHVGGASSSRFGKTSVAMAAMAARGVFFEKYWGIAGARWYVLMGLPVGLLAYSLRAVKNRDARYLRDLRGLVSLASEIWINGGVAAQDRVVRPLFSSELPR